MTNIEEEKYGVINLEQNSLALHNLLEWHLFHTWANQNFEVLRKLI